MTEFHDRKRRHSNIATLLMATTFLFPAFAVVASVDSTKHIASFQFSSHSTLRHVSSRLNAKTEKSKKSAAEETSTLNTLLAKQSTIPQPPAVLPDVVPPLPEIVMGQGVETALQDGKQNMMPRPNLPTLPKTSLPSLSQIALSVLQGAASLTQRAAKSTVTILSQLSKQVQVQRQTAAQTATPVAKYFAAWNAQNVDAALALFAPNCTHEDATFASSLEGKAALQRYCLLSWQANSDTKRVLDDMAISPKGDKIGVTYHLECNQAQLANSRRNAFYTIDPQSKLITSCFDVKEPVFKTGIVDLSVLSVVGELVFNKDEDGKTPLQRMLPDPLAGVRQWWRSLFVWRWSNFVLEKWKSMRGTSHGRQGKAQETMEPALRSTSVDPAINNVAASVNMMQWGRSNLEGLIANSKKTAPERYFEAWNRRDMTAAASVFSEDCYYEDTVFPNAFSGKASLQRHLKRCAKAFPETFEFVVDDIAGGRDRLAVRWHVENKGELLPFTRGCSFYTVNVTTGKIETGLDEIEPAVWKLGGVSLFLESLKTKITAEPQRMIPLALWASYMYIVFFSNGILPGANALELEQRTWEEVRDLSINFFLVSPLLDLPFSPTVHPILEGVFNLLLSWAALFAGFFSDDREKKPNLLPVVPVVVGMQFLTSAFLLPYLVTRTTETLPEGKAINQEDLSTAARVVESPLLGGFLGLVGTGSILWGILARHPDFGDWNERVASFWELMSIDRVGSSFLVDLALFAVFQGWLIDDDLRRRGLRIDQGEYSVLRNVAKYVPFFGLASYMALRPTFSSQTEESP